MAYAIVKTGGKQYKVAVGDVVEVEKLWQEMLGEETYRALSEARWSLGDRLLRPAMVKVATA